MNEHKSNKLHSKRKSKTLFQHTPDGATWAVAGSPMPSSSIPRGINDKIYGIVQEFTSLALGTTSTSVNTYFSADFALSLLDQVSSLTALFDQYRVHEIEAWITPRCIQSSNAPTQYCTVVDLDDYTVLSTYPSATDYQNIVQSTVYDGHYRRWRPRAAVAAYSGTFVSYANVGNMWMDCASTGVQWYGLKGAVALTTTAFPIDLVYRVHLQFRNVR